MRPKGIILHHTVTRKDASARLIRKNHMEKRRFKDIGYHFLIRLSRRRGEWIVETGRPCWMRGAHCPGHQDWIGVAVAGDYEEHDLPLAALAHLKAILAQLCAEYELRPKAQVKPHREFRKTLCPGSKFMARFKEIIDYLDMNLPQ